MNTLQQFTLPRTWLLLLAIATLSFLTPSLAHAQSSGPTVNVCTSDEYESGSGYNEADVEETVCIYGGASELGGSASADSLDGAFVPSTGAEGWLYDGSTYVVGTGSYDFRDAESSAYATTPTITPHINDTYTMIGQLYECYDYSGQYDQGECVWNQLDQLSASGQVTSPPTPTLSLTTSGSPSTYGQSVTFTATISSGPTGSVIFDDASTQIGTGAISGTTATFVTSGLSVGSHSITASYPGNSNYAAASSSPITQVVTASAPPPTSSITYTYDSQGRVATATYVAPSGNRAVTYSYDNAGNRTSVVTQ